MDYSLANRRSPLGFFLARRLRIYDRVVEILRTRHYSRRTEQAVTAATRHWCFLVMPNGKSLMQVSLNRG